MILCAHIIRGEVSAVISVIRASYTCVRKAMGSNPYRHCLMVTKTEINIFHYILFRYRNQELHRQFNTFQRNDFFLLWVFNTVSNASPTIIIIMLQ